MKWTQGHTWFTLFFCTGFIVLLIWSYRKDANLHRLHFPYPVKVLIALLAFITSLYLIVKFRHGF
ncbi:MAG: hypothetical protein ACO259_06940 [Bacteroidia bacterium]|nr:hypothetical protein [Bacteroidia bacterium]NBY10778.1 hypothetical protein [Sphingobacteriia bacterium]